MKVSPSRSVCHFIMAIVVMDAQAWMPPHHIKRQNAPFQQLRAAAAANALGDDSSATQCYKRTFYRFTSGSDVDTYNAAVLEDRIRLHRDSSGTLVPVSRSLIVRDGQVEEGDIGDEWFTLDTSSLFSNAQIAAALYLMSNPALVSCCPLTTLPGVEGGRIWHLGAESAVASLVGIVGAAHCLKDKATAGGSSGAVADDDILTLQKKPSVFPPHVQTLTVADTNESKLRVAIDAAKDLGVPSGQLRIDPVDWHVRQQARGQQAYYRTILATDLSFAYPEAKEVARKVAHHLEASSFYLTDPDPTLPLPRFVYVCREEEEELPYLRKLLEKGYRMSTTTEYLKVEKISFAMQEAEIGDDDFDLDDLELEVSEWTELPVQCLTAQHHPDFVGGGSGELFFPMETGAYDALDSNNSPPWRG